LALWIGGPRRPASDGARGRRGSSSSHRNERDRVVSGRNRPSVKARNTSVAAGIDKYVTGNLTLGGVSYTPATLKAVFLDQNAAIDASDAKHQEWQDQVQATHAAAAKADAVYDLLRNWVISQFGKLANAVLGAFGMPVPKAKGPQTPAAKVASAKKAKATRQLRHTMGSVQRKAVKGTIEVPVTSVTTVTPVLPPPAATTETTPEPATAAPAAAPGSPAKPGS
jgi:hypothetical protein